MFTEREIQILKAIVKYIDNRGYSPTIREIGSEVGLSSSSTVHGYLDRLHKKGCIKKKESSPRAIVITLKGKEVINNI